MKKIAKSLTAVLCAVLTLGFTACQRDYEDLIIGSWNVENVVSISTELDRTFTDTYTPADEGESMVFTFNKDNSFAITRSWTQEGVTRTDTLRGSYSINDNMLSVVMPHFIRNDEGELVTEEVTTRFTIDKLDKKEMAITESESSPDGDYSWSNTYNLKKI